MDNYKHLFIINPAAGKSDQTQAFTKVITQIAAKHSLDYKIVVTQYPKHALTLVEEEYQNSDKPLRLYACGGDGTLNEVAQSAIKLNVPVTHFPGGSGNDYIKIFTADPTPFFNLENLIFGEEVLLDYILTDHSISLNIFSVGADANVAYRMQKYKRLPFLHGSAAYMAATCETLVRGLNDTYSVTINGKNYDGEYALVFVGNGRWYGGGFCPVPDAEPDDGILDILLVNKISRIKAASVLNLYKTGRYQELPDYVTHLQAQNITVSTQNPKGFAANLDGEIVLTNSISAELVPKKLRFILPKGLKK